eukprot:scaffold24_cov128-Cylindrotheca_fusiformis.AAC.2
MFENDSTETVVKRTRKQKQATPPTWLWDTTTYSPPQLDHKQSAALRSSAMTTAAGTAAGVQIVAAPTTCCCQLLAQRKTFLMKKCKWWERRTNIGFRTTDAPVLFTSLLAILRLGTTIQQSTKITTIFATAMLRRGEVRGVTTVREQGSIRPDFQFTAGEGIHLELEGLSL